MTAKLPILYWPRRTTGDNEYQLARKVINNSTGVMPDVCTDDLDIVGILHSNPNAVIYYPVFCGSTGWWGELLGGDAVVSDKLIISPECQLMVIELNTNAKSRGQTQLLAAEIYPTSGFFKKMNSNIATVADTSSGQQGQSQYWEGLGARRGGDDRG